MYNLLLLTNYYNGIPQVLHETQSLDIGRLKGYFQRHFSVKVCSYEDVISDKIKFISNNTVVFYASSQYPAYKSFMQDILIYLKNSGCVLVPDINIFFSHENKLFQMLQMRFSNISSPNILYISSLEDGVKKLKSVKYPVVIKMSHGFASSFVECVNNIDEGLEFIKRHYARIIPKAKNFFRTRQIKSRYIGKHPLRVGSSVVQQFIDNIDYDWKVLVFYNKYFILKRYCKKNDFRASGSGLFELDPEPDYDVLGFSKYIYEKINSPFLSLDIIKKNGICYLIEYQGCHFGLYALINSNYCYYLDINGEWKLSEKSDAQVEFYFYESIIAYLKKNNSYFSDL
ncbi:MAG: hypothetical protein ACQESF_06190 [Nanobdellota archaeon]